MRYCRAGKKNKKSHSGHRLRKIRGQREICLVVVLYILLKSHSSVCRLLSNLNFELLKSVMHANSCTRVCVQSARIESWQKMNETHDMFDCS